jgi:hypothetical protein
MTRPFFTSLVAFSCLFGIALPSIVSAQSGSFVVRPAKVEVAGAPGETVETSITLTNQLGVPATFSVSFEDVAGSENPDDPAMLLGGKRGPYPLRDFLRGPKSISLIDGQEKRITISALIPADASPGGLYGSVIFTPVRQKGDGNVIPDSRIGVLVFLRVEGDAKEEGSLKDFGYEGGRFVFGTPDTKSVASILFENVGTVHLSPYGAITVSSLFGNSKEIPIDPWYVLPKSTRNRTLEIGDALSYGRNTLLLTLHSGYGDKTETRELSVWVFPSQRAIGITLAVLAVLLVLILRRGRRLHV